MSTTTVRLSTGVTSCSWRLSNGVSGSWSLQDGISQSWTRAAGSLYFTGFSLGTNYRHPIYFERDDGYQQQVTTSSGGWSDNEIAFTSDKSGTLVATYVAPAPTYTLSYNGNNATGGSTASQSGASSYYVRQCGFYKTGHTFDYWRTASGTAYNPGDLITLSSNTTLYAQWKANTYTISYNANGGSGAPANQTKRYGTTLTLSSTKPTWSGHTFLAWGKSSARDAPVAYNAGGSYTENASRTLYAIWIVTASFYSKGELYSQSSVRIGGSVTAPSISNTATEGLYRWRVSDTEIYSPGNSISLSSHKNVYAVWKNIYTVSYNANGGSNAPASQTKWQDVDLTLSTDKPTWNGHTFLGWSTSSSRTAEINYSSGSTYKTNAALTLYAVWLCTASFYSNDALFAQQNARIGQTITCPSISNTETQVFTGWRLNDDEIYHPGDTITLTTHINLYAIWVSGYQLTYNGNNADGGSTPSPPLAVTYTISQCGFYKSGYYFQYWRTASGTKYYPGDSLTPTKAMTLYAQWKTRVHFYWHGSDANDAVYFARGKRIDLAVTATAWNSLCDFINDVRTDIRLSTIAFARVSAGDEISAVKFNIVSNAIRQIVNAGYGTVVPATVSAGEEIVTSLFNGLGSLKDAINKAVDEL